jgi:hypothetical protein
MEAAELRAVQAPLKDRYRAEPTVALVTLKAEVRLGDESVSCSVVNFPRFGGQLGCGDQAAGSTAFCVS